ncbi:MAG: hypothetical protein RDV41_07830 [Planctomycetota bacterium]|nr:hypothetical protein [Planctomycetota bacterium]
MSVIELTVRSHDRIGELARITEPLARAKVNIRGIAIVDRGDDSQVRLILDNFVKGRQVLADSGFQCTSAEVLAVEIENAPGELNRLAKCLADAQINIKYTYPLHDRTPLCVLVIGVTEQELDPAIQSLEKQGFSFLLEHGPE